LAERIRVSVGDRTRGLITMDWKRDEFGIPAVPLTLEGTYTVTEDIFDLESWENRSTGKLRVKVYYKIDEFSGGEHEGFKLWLGDVANITIEPVKYIEAQDLEIKYPAQWPSGVPYVVLLTDSELTRLGFEYPEDATYTKPEHFRWISNNTEVADILDDGTIIPKSPGKVTFTLQAINNGKPERLAEITTQEIEIYDSGDASIVVPSMASPVYVMKNQDALILWTTNVMNKLREKAGEGQTPKDAHFRVQLFEGNWRLEELAGRTPVAQWAAPNAGELVNSTIFVIPGQHLTNVSEAGEPAYTVLIETAHPDRPELTLSAAAHIVVRPLPVSVQLDKSIGTGMTDDEKEVVLQWTMERFNAERGEFWFEVTKNGVPVPGSRITYDAQGGQFSHSGAGPSGGAYTLRWTRWHRTLPSRTSMSSASRRGTGRTKPGAPT